MFDVQVLGVELHAFPQIQKMRGRGPHDVWGEQVCDVSEFPVYSITYITCVFKHLQMTFKKLIPLNFAA